MPVHRNNRKYPPNSQKKEYLAGDHLHPSAKEYTIWAERLAEVVAKTLKQ